MVAYDDAASFTAKGEFIALGGLRGFSMWEGIAYGYSVFCHSLTILLYSLLIAGGDYNDILLDAIRNGAGFPAAEGGDGGEGECETSSIGGHASTGIASGTGVAINPPFTTHAAGGAGAGSAATSSTAPVVTQAPGNIGGGAVVVTSTVSAATSKPTTSIIDDGDDDDDCEDEETTTITSTHTATATATGTATSSAASVTATTSAEEEEYCDE